MVLDSIFPFHKKNLKIASHIMVMKNFIERQNVLTITHPKFAPLRAALVAAVEKEDKDYKADLASQYTPDISAADEKRDRAWGAMMSLATALAGGVGTDAQTKAANDILAVRTKYDVNVSRAMPEETAKLNQAIADLEARGTDFAVLGLTQIFADLKAANKIVDDGINNRQNNRAYIATGVTAANRAATDAAYDALVAFFIATDLLYPTEELTKFIAEWNSMVNYYRTTLLGSKAYSQVSTDGDYDGGETDGETPQQPATPPAHGGGDDTDFSA